MLHAMRAGNTTARYYIDRAESPTVCLIHEGHHLFVSGDASGPTTDDALCYLNDTLLTTNKRRELHLLQVLYSNDDWKDKIATGMQGVTIEAGSRCLYTQKAWAAHPLDTEACIRSITADLMRSPIDNLEMIVHEVSSTLGSLDKFLSRGFGYTLVLDNRISGFCTSEYQSAGECAIGIEVLTPFQRQGYASKMVAGFLAECRERHLQPYWECWSDNIASIRTAERNGFARVADYPVLVITF